MDPPASTGRPLCQYGKRCFLKNPTHFKDFSHPLLEGIVRKGKDENNEYDIPEGILQPIEGTREQLRMVEEVLNNARAEVAQKSCEKLVKPTCEPPPNESDSKKGIKEQEKNLIGRYGEEYAEGPLKRAQFEDKSNKPADVKHQIKDEPGSSTSDSSQLLEPKRAKLEEKPKTEGLENAAPEHPDHAGFKIEDYIKDNYQKGQAIKKFEASKPYNFFLTTIADCEATHHEELSITLQDILDPSLGDLECSVQINYMIDPGWLLAHYDLAGHALKPLLAIYGHDKNFLWETIKLIRPNIASVHIDKGMYSKGPYFLHHSKMMLLGYKDKSMRVVVSTANLNQEDWKNRIQGVWISPKCHEIVSGATNGGESVTGFRSDLIRYLEVYQLPELEEWIGRIRRTNFEDVKVCLVTSVPGSYTVHDSKYGHLRMGLLLAKHAAPIRDSCPLIVQTSSIGNLGKTIKMWISEISSSFGRDSEPLRTRSMAPFKMIYPSLNDVLASHDGIMGGGCLPYSEKQHKLQPWLVKHMHRWCSYQRYRTKSIPHLKTYCRYSADEGLYWFCLSSANLSKSAWGSVYKTHDDKEMFGLSNFEMGVLFLPKFMTNSLAFPLQKPKVENERPHLAFPLPFDLPLTPYAFLGKKKDKPFFQDDLINTIKLHLQRP